MHFAEDSNAGLHFRNPCPIVRFCVLQGSQLVQGDEALVLLLITGTGRGCLFASAHDQHADVLKHFIFPKVFQG